MSRLNKTIDLTDSDSDDDFNMGSKSKVAGDSAANVPKSSSFARPSSSLKSNNDSSSSSKQKKKILDDSDDEEYQTKQSLKSGSTTSITSKLKNAVKNTFMSKSKKSSKDSKSKKSKNSKRSQSDSESESTRSKSIERSIKNVAKIHNKSKNHEFARPETRLDNTMSSNSSDTTLDSSRSNPNDTTLNKSSSDNDEGVKTSKAKKIVSTSENSELSSSDDNDSLSDSDSDKSIKGVKVIKKTGKTSDSNSDSDTEQEEVSTPIRVTIGTKPPIDKSKLHKKYSSLERPESESGSDTERGYKLDQKHQKSRFLGKTFDLDSDHSQSSGNEMTDVSPLQTPKNNASLNMNVFYKALEKDLDNAYSKSPKRSALKKSKSLGIENNNQNQNSYDQTAASSFDYDYGYTSHVNNSLDLDNPEFSYQISPMSTKVMRSESANQRMYKKLVKPSVGTGYVSPYKEKRPFRVTSSALNRQREQQRIEKENQLILKRLLTVKASKHVVKEEQLKDYEKNLGLSSLSYSKMAPLPPSMGSTPTHSSLGHNSILNRSGASSKRSTFRSNSRCSSAKSNTHSQLSNMSRNSIDPNYLIRRANSSSRRPQWNDKW